MQALFENFKKDFKKFNIISKYILIIGTPIVLFIALVTLYCKISIIFGFANDIIYTNYKDLLMCLKESIGAVYFGSFFLEFLHLLSIKYD